MEKFIITTGKTIDLAIEAAMAELGLDRDSISIEILEREKSGFLGIGATPAKIKATYEGPAEDNAPALSAVSRSPKKKPAPKPETKPAGPKQEAKPVERKPEQTPEVKAVPTPDAPAPAGSTEERIEQFLNGLMQKMGSAAVAHAEKSDAENYRVELVGENLGMLIGRRGETLDAIQHLTNYVVNRGGSKRVRVTVDAEGYRAKREEALGHLAEKVAAKVMKFRRNVTLEPMNAYERHVIHAALQSNPNVSTFSTGTEPNRRVVVVYGKTAAQEE